MCLAMIALLVLHSPDQASTNRDAAEPFIIRIERLDNLANLGSSVVEAMTDQVVHNHIDARLAALRTAAERDLTIGSSAVIQVDWYEGYEAENDGTRWVSVKYLGTGDSTQSVIDSERRGPSVTALPPLGYGAWSPVRTKSFLVILTKLPSELRESREPRLSRQRRQS